MLLAKMPVCRWKQAPPHGIQGKAPAAVPVESPNFLGEPVNRYRPAAVRYIWKAVCRRFRSVLNEMAGYLPANTNIRRISAAYPLV